MITSQKRGKIAMAASAVAIGIALLINSSTANAKIDPGGGDHHFCKNDPTANTGRCYVWATGASCDPSTTSNKDCFGTGVD